MSLRIFDFLNPKSAISADETQRGIRAFTIEGAATMGLGSITGSGLLTAYALALGASNSQIGLLAALPFLFMPFQLATVAFVEKFQKRKMIATPLWLLAQSIWIPIALIPVFIDAPGGGAVTVLLLLMALRSGAVAMQNAAWNSWLRDLVPAATMGSIFANRLKYANIAAMAFGVGAALFVDYWTGAVDAEQFLMGYTIALLFGAVVLGGASQVFRALIPEPKMLDSIGERRSLISTLIEPFKDPNYRPLMIFMMLWHFALYLATPFFAVYMLQRLDFPVSVVLGMSVVSQLFNVFFLRFWGPLIDRVGNKAVLRVSASLYLVVILGWTFTTNPDRHVLSIPLVILLHVFAGAAAAGATVTTGTIGMKLAPIGKSTSYVAAISVLANLGAGLGPLVGGLMADYLKVRSLSINFEWLDPSHSVSLAAISLRGFDFLFVIAFILGVLTLNILSIVQEEGDEGQDVVLDALYAHARRATDPMSSVPGFGLLTQYPFGYMRRIPGLDVVAGVTAYQVAEATHLAATAASRTGRGLKHVSSEIRKASTSAFKSGANMEAYLIELGRHAARGAALALAQSGHNAEDVIQATLNGSVESMVTDQGLAPEDALLAASIGTLEGSMETGNSLDESVESTTAAAIELARDFGIDHETTIEIMNDAAKRVAGNYSEGSVDSL
ncbi:MAG: MFS transporter [Chloroflexi bacterium]|nr:MFS transporter [Chloroflexota bacterium]